MDFGAYIFDINNYNCFNKMPSNAKMQRKKEEYKIYYHEKQLRILENTVKDRDKKLKETFFFMHRKEGQVCWANNDELLVEMRRWRKYRKDNILTISAENNGEYIISGRTYYTMVLQQLDADGEVEGIGIDPLALGLGVMVDGMVYWFISKANRDAVVKYVMN